MLEGPKQVWVYETAGGKRPLDEWFEKLDYGVFAAIEARLDRLEYGHLGHFNIVGSGIVELKIDKGPGYRIYLAVVDHDCLVVLCGGDKSTQTRDILKAKEYLAEYRARI